MWVLHSVCILHLFEIHTKFVTLANFMAVVRMVILLPVLFQHKRMAYNGGALVHMSGVLKAQRYCLHATFSSRVVTVHRHTLLFVFHDIGSNMFRTFRVCVRYIDT